MIPAMASCLAHFPLDWSVRARAMDAVWPRFLHLETYVFMTLPPAKKSLTNKANRLRDCAFRRMVRGSWRPKMARSTFMTCRPARCSLHFLPLLVPLAYPTRGNRFLAFQPDDTGAGGSVVLADMGDASVAAVLNTPAPVLRLHSSAIRRSNRHRRQPLDFPGHPLPSPG